MRCTHVFASDEAATARERPTGTVVKSAGRCQSCWANVEQACRAGRRSGRCGAACDLPSCGGELVEVAPRVRGPARERRRCARVEGVAGQGQHVVGLEGDEPGAVGGLLVAHVARVDENLPPARPQGEAAPVHVAVQCPARPVAQRVVARGEEGCPGVTPEDVAGTVDGHPLSGRGTARATRQRVRPFRPELGGSSPEVPVNGWPG